MADSTLDNSNGRTSNNTSTSFNHARVVVELAHEILANPKDNKELCKVLSDCNVTEEDQDLVKVIEFLLGEVMEQKEIQQDKLIPKRLAKFATALKCVDKNPATSLTPSKVSKIRDKMKLMSDTVERGASDNEELKPKRKPQRKLPQKKPQQKKPTYKSDRYAVWVLVVDLIII